MEKKSTPTEYKKILVYSGISDGYGVMNVLNTNKFTHVYLFEANPDSIKKINPKFRHPNIHIIWAACVSKVPESGMVDFNIASNDGGSSSIGEFNPEWCHAKSGEIKMVKKIQVPAINLYNWCLMNQIDYIDTYISDIQGADYMVLETLKPMIEKKLIGRIQCETAKDNRLGNLYKLQSNELKTFRSLLEPYYKISSTGWVCGILNENSLNSVPEDWDEFDCLWVPNK